MANSSKGSKLEKLMDSIQTMLGSLDHENVQAMANIISKGIKLEKLSDSIGKMLGSIDHKYFQACSITSVPDQLRKSKAEAYMPKVVSIGPLHRGTRRDLLYMEDIKWRYMLSLLHRKEHVVEERLSQGSKEISKDAAEEGSSQCSSKTSEDVAEERFSQCIKEIFELDEVVRASYNVVDIKFNSYDLAKIMLLDGCFLLEILIRNSKELDGQLKSSFKPPELKPGKMEEILSDLTVLENQIPFAILIRLSTLLFPNVFIDEDGVKSIKKLALSLLGYPPPPDSSISEAAHVLELVHSSIPWKLSEEGAGSQSSPNSRVNLNAEKSQESDTPSNSGDIEKVERNQESDTLEIIVNEEIKESKEVQQSKVAGKSQLSEEGEKSEQEVLKLTRCASKLQAAGVEIKPLHSVHQLSEEGEKNQQSTQGEKSHQEVLKQAEKTQAARAGFDLRIEFSDRKLEISQLHITETTEVMWRNFIVWELNRKDHTKFITLNQSGSKFICYALFFQGLICCEHDIQLLKDLEVIVVHDDNANSSKRDIKKKKKISNEDLRNLFYKITEGVHVDQIDMDSYFQEQFRKINKHSSTVCCAKEKGTIVYHYCRWVLTEIWYICRNWFAILKRDHMPTVWRGLAVVVAVILLGLTIAQTVFGALGL